MMTDKQTAFVKEFALTGNATQSAIKTGYSEKSTYRKGHQLRWQFQHQIEDEGNPCAILAIPRGCSLEIQEVSINEHREKPTNIS